MCRTEKKDGFRVRAITLEEPLTGGGHQRRGWWRAEAAGAHAAAAPQTLAEALPRADCSA